MSEITKITVQSTYLSESYFPKNEPVVYGVHTFTQLQEELNKRSASMVAAHNLVSMLNATGDVDGSIENALKGTNYREGDLDKKKKVVFLYGLTVYIYFKG